MRNDKKQEPTSALTRSMAAIIRGEYNALDMTQAELVQKTGISLATVQRLIKGEQKFNLDQLEAFANALELPLEELSRRAVEWRSTRMSEAATDNVTPLRNWTAGEIDADKKSKRAAHSRDDESDVDETD